MPERRRSDGLPVRLALVALALAAVAAATPAAGDEVSWTSDVRGALRRAARESRPIVVDVWAVWCAPCKLMDESTWADAAVRSAIEGAVALKVDADADAVFVERYRAGEALPTTLFLDAQGNEIGRFVGAVGPRRMAAAVETLTAGYRRWLATRDVRDDLEALRASARYVQELGNGRESVERLRRARKLAAKQGRPALERDVLDLEYAVALADLGESREACEELAGLADRTADPAVRGRALLALADAERVRGNDGEAAAALERLRAEFPDLAPAAGSAP